MRALDLTRIIHRVPLRLSTTLGLALALGSASCSLVVFSSEECQSDDHCAEAFGEGSVCGGAGYCEMPGEISSDVECATNLDCLEGAGFGSSCNLEEATEEVPGVCDTIQAPSRCTGRSFPADLIDDPSAYANRVVFGVLSDRTIQSHSDREDAIELAITQINDSGGLDGTQLGLIYCDIGQGDAGGYSDGLARPDAAVSVAEWLVNVASVPVIFGAPSSGDTQLVFEEVTNQQDVRGQTLLISTSATDPSIVDFDVPAPGKATDNNPGLLWRTAGNGSAQIEALVADMEAAGLANVAVIREQSPFAGTQLATSGSFAQSFIDDWGAESEQFTYPGGNVGGREQKIREVAASVAAGMFDAILFIGPTEDAQAFLRQATASADVPDGFPIYFNDGGANDEVFDGINNSRLFATTKAARPMPTMGFEYDSFAQSFQSGFGNVDPLRSTFTANAYDAAWFAALGSAWALFQGDESMVETTSGHHILRGKDIARGMRATTTGTAVAFLPAEWNKVISQFRSARPINVKGAASEYAFDLGDEDASGEAIIVVGSDAGTFSPAVDE